MKKKENIFKSWFVKALRTNGAIVRVIETGVVTAAFPDVYYAHDGVTMLIEIKQQENIDGPSFTRKVPFREGQQSFLVRNRMHGGNSMVAISYRNCFVCTDVIWIDSNEHLIESGERFVSTKESFTARDFFNWVHRNFKSTSVI